MSHVAYIYPHHDLLNLAHYHLKVVEDKVEKENSDSIALDCMSCLIALAIGVEGLINFSGSKLIEDWKERQGYKEKLEQVADALQITADENIEPFKTLKDLKKLRDSIAHPKPLTRSAKITSHQELDELMQTTWDPLCNPDYINHAFKQVNKFEELIYQNPSIFKSGILTSATGWGELK